LAPQLKKQDHGFFEFGYLSERLGL